MQNSLIIMKHALVDHKDYPVNIMVDICTFYIMIQIFMVNFKKTGVHIPFFFL